MKSFYMICTRDTVGSNASFHCKDGKGYATDIDKAHIYTLEEAQKAWEHGRSIDQPVCTESVLSLAEYHVDCQYIPRETVIQEGCTSYVGYVKGDWDGNDVYWLNDRGYPSTNFSIAKRFTTPDLTMDNIVWLPLDIADAQKRRTFRLANFNARSMVQSAGLRVPEWLKKQRRRKGNSGKTRWNCPCCGKISWQYDPYTFSGCLDIYCREYRPIYEWDK
ncbi:hypothetical protein V5070_02855 [Moellerella wisconsensis]|uniref:Uncharacterized protein n=2 Tax=Moellerella wisconsensis TaxID=158849 RepID=A0A0N0I994_9GAMM|nr:hypothetical protein [Moellerella wisconsensis]KPD01973.1 hypothetical protein M992_2516 [Moellerella wisconsensis ATCC 35017]VFS54176.1 Uncharacterised protein [Moellerella wisconsensis]